MDINPSVSDKITPLYKKKSFYIISAIGFVVALISSLVLWNMFGASMNDEYSGEHIVEKVSDTQPIASTEKGVTYPERKFMGTLMSIGPDAKFVRVFVKDEGMYSVALTAETKITVNGIDTDIKAFTPMSVVSITSSELPDTEPYDFSARSIAGGSEVSTPDLTTASSVGTGVSETGDSQGISSSNAESQGLHTQEKLKELIKESSAEGALKQ